MSVIQHNIEREKRLIGLLGYSLVGPDSSDHWLIVDENQNQVGYIQYKKFHNINSNKKYSKLYKIFHNVNSKKRYSEFLGYDTLINSSNIFASEFSRRWIDKNGKMLDSPDGTGVSYPFYIKRENQEMDRVEMDIGDFPSLTVWSEKYGFIKFKVDNQGLYLNFKRKTDNFNIEELLIYKNVGNGYHNNKEYVYRIRYCKKDLELSDINDKNITTREISGTQYYYDKNHLRISEKTWVGEKLRTNRESIVEGTVKEMATKHQIGIDCFNHFRFVINQIIPFNEDIISTIVNHNKVKQANLTMFFLVYAKEISETSVQKKLTPNKKN